MKVTSIKKSALHIDDSELYQDEWPLLSKRLSKTKLKALRKAELNKYRYYLQAYHQKKPMGYAALGELKWDTKHFARKMGQIDLRASAASKRRRQLASGLLISELLKKAKETRFNHLSLKIDNKLVDEIDRAERAGFLYMASLISYCLNLKDFKSSLSLDKIDIKPARKTDHKAIKKIAHDSFSNINDWLDRFHADINLPKKLSDHLYVQWINNCLKGAEADMVLASFIKNKPVGFISAKTDKAIKKHLGLKVATIPLNAVSKKYRGRGIYKYLVNSLLIDLKNKGYDAAIITTQLSTRAVAKTWLSMGASIFSSRMVFHKTLR
jgi:GNAT superfamily N-acetyltransferase